MLMVLKSTCKGGKSDGGGTVRMEGKESVRRAAKIFLRTAQSTVLHQVFGVESSRLSMSSFFVLEITFSTIQKCLLV